MWSGKTYSFILTVISGFGTFFNLKCFDYVKKTFDTKVNVFYILAQDSLTTAVGSGLFFITNLINLIDEDVLKSKTGCVSHFLGLYLTCMLAPTSTLMISLRRFVLLKYPTLVPHNSTLANLIASIALATVGIYYFTFLILSILLDLKNVIFIEQCLGNNVVDNSSQVSLISKPSFVHKYLKC